MFRHRCNTSINKVTSTPETFYSCTSEVLSSKLVVSPAVITDVSFLKDTKVNFAL